MKQYMSIVLCLFIGFTCLFSCARTVTGTEDTLFIEFNITFNDTVDSSLYNYYLLFSKSNTSAIAPDTINIEEYFISPALTYSTIGVDFNANANGSIQYYYETFFNTWSDYIIIQDGASNLISSESDAFLSTTTDNDNYIIDLYFEHSLEINDRTITVTFDIEQLDLIADDTLYFRFLTAKRATEFGSNDQSGLLQDTISETKSILLSNQQESSSTESIQSSEFGGAIDMAGDIISWEVSVF